MGRPGQEDEIRGGQTPSPVRGWRLCQLSAGGEPGEETHAPKGSLCSLVTGWSTSWTSSPGPPRASQCLLSTLPHWWGPASSPLAALPLGSRCWSATSAQGPRLPPRNRGSPRGWRKAPSASWGWQPA